MLCAVLLALSGLAPAPQPNHVLGRRPLVSSVASAFVGAALPALPALPAAAVVNVDPKSVKTTAKGVKYVQVKPGACPLSDPLGKLGTCLPEPGSFAVVDFTGFLPSGEVFDTTEKKGGKALVFKIGANQVIPGLDDLVQSMLPGEEVQALIPADLAYGDKGVCTENGECLIPPKTALKYFVRFKRLASNAF